MSLAVAALQGETRDKQLWRLFAYLGRYGHQPLPVLRKLPITELLRYANAVAELIREESEANRQAAEV